MQDVSHSMEVSKATESRLPTHPPQRLLDERAIERLHLDLVVVEPTAKAAYRTLAILGSTDHKRGPRAEAHRVGVDQAHHHPRQGLEVTKVEPIGMLAQHPNQRIIEVRRVLHESPPWKGSLIEWYGGSILTRC